MIDRERGARIKTSWEIEREKERMFEERVRDLMNKHRITYQEAEQLIKTGQKGLFDFR